MKIIDYGMGNLRSVAKALESLGYLPEITNDKDRLRSAKGLILPGVGAFADAMANLAKYDLIEVIQEHVKSGKPFLGICLGMQLLLDVSYEGGSPVKGLGIFPGEVKELPREKIKLKVPHMGWNQLHFCKESRLFKGISEGAFVYFVHSFYAVPEDKNVLAAVTDYGMDVTAALEQDNIFATQFHPEKSSEVGLRILKNFGELVEG